jgi:hypothetical protein
MNLAGSVILRHPQILKTIPPILPAYLLNEMGNVFTSTLGGTFGGARRFVFRVPGKGVEL